MKMKKSAASAKKLKFSEVDDGKDNSAYLFEEIINIGGEDHLVQKTTGNMLRYVRQR